MRFVIILGEIFDDGTPLSLDEAVDLLNEVDPDANKELEFLEKEVVKLSNKLLEICRDKDNLVGSDIESILKIADHMRYGY